MNTIESLFKTPFFEITTVLDDFARLDDIIRLDNNEGERPPLLPHEVCLRNVKTIIMGITSSVSYMQLAIIQIKRRYNAKYNSAYGYTEYDFYRYHYSEFCHSLATIHDLYFKLVVELCDFNIGSKRMIQWDKLRNALNAIGEDEIIALLENYYSIIKEHEQKRNMASHEGLLYSKMLDNYHLTNIWSRIPTTHFITSTSLKYTKGTKENKYLLAKTKKAFVDELNRLTDTTGYSTRTLFELLLPKLLYKMNPEFIKSHRQELIELNIESINIHVLGVIS